MEPKGYHFTKPCQFAQCSLIRKAELIVVQRMLSGATGTTFNAGNDMVRKNTVDAAAAAGCTGDPEGQSTLECLRSLPFEKLNNAAIGLARKARPPFGEQFFTASVDGDYIPERPSLLLGRGDFVKGEIYLYFATSSSS